MHNGCWCDHCGLPESRDCANNIKDHITRCGPFVVLNCSVDVVDERREWLQKKRPRETRPFFVFILKLFISR